MLTDRNETEMKQCSLSDFRLLHSTHNGKIKSFVSFVITCVNIQVPSKSHGVTKALILMWWYVSLLQNNLIYLYLKNSFYNWLHFNFTSLAVFVEIVPQLSVIVIIGTKCFSLTLCMC